jgi:FkbM family methyltransferase
LKLNPKQAVKELIFKRCGPGLQHKLRRLNVVHEILHDLHAREPEMALLTSLVVKGDWVADVGANVGIYTKEVSTIVGGNGKVFSFEPVWENYDILITLVRKAHLDNVSPLRVALGSQLSQCEVVIPNMTGFKGYYWAHLAQPGDQGRREVIEVLTLDEMRRRQIITRLDFVKCDVEGGELQVILGGQQILREQRPGWLLEVSRDTSREVFEALQGLGYRAFVFDGRLIETANYRDKEFSNYFFFHPQTACWRRASALMARA